MPTLTIQVPPEHRDDLLRELLMLYGVKTDALHHTVVDYLRTGHSPARLLADRAELAAIDTLIEQLGWRLYGPPQAADLTGETHLLAEVARGALTSALGELTDVLSGSSASLPEVQALGRTLRRVSALYELIQDAYRLPEQRSV